MGNPNQDTNQGGETGQDNLSEQQRREQAQQQKEQQQKSGPQPSEADEDE
jgi:hypothetical protein